jgi:dUTP pyrophosphatase
MERSDFEKYLRQLEDLDKQIGDDSDPEPLIDELNKVLNGLSSEIKLDTAKKALSATLTFINTSNNPDPVFDHEGDSGFNIRASLNRDILIDIGRSQVIPTGLYFEVDKGLEVQIRPNSELSENSNMMILNSPITVDSSYRGEVKIILGNFDTIPHTIRNGNKIAQGVVCPVYGEGNLNFVKVNNFRSKSDD